ncbi:MAG: Holliday junction resolvase RuvX [Acidimicrobiia bacterium]|nr:Holliday junction resolvase RuvX [bacterium]MXX63739.1 Holliday junction resolvase RuvX [Acidimicrobiia bacterium]
MPDHLTDAPSPGRGRIMGIDYGHRRVGVALSDGLGLAAHPHEVIETGPKLFSRLEDLIRSEQVTRVVIGLPISLDGTEQAAARRARRFAEQIRRRWEGLEVLLYDEKLTTRIADDALLASGLSRRKRRHRVDKVAAAVMLQGYLDHQSRVSAG